MVVYGLYEFPAIYGCSLSWKTIWLLWLYVLFCNQCSTCNLLFGFTLIKGFDLFAWWGTWFRSGLVKNKPRGNWGRVVKKVHGKSVQKFVYIFRSIYFASELNKLKKTPKNSQAARTPIKPLKKPPAPTRKFPSIHKQLWRIILAIKWQPKTCDKYMLRSTPSCRV